MRQSGAPRQPVPASSAPVEVDMRFKYSRPKGYYVAAEIRPPGESQATA